jgi:UPF0716 family protein affecting phage T7 exclusion
MFLTFAIFSFVMMYAEFQTVSKVYSLIANQTDSISAVAIVALSFLAIASFGGWLIKSQSRSLVHKLQNISQSGTVPKPNILLFIAGVLFIVPGYVTDILALLLLFPPTAWLVKKMFQHKLKKFQDSGNVKFYGSFGGQARQQQRYERAQGREQLSHDPNVIDVEVIKS